MLSKSKACALSIPLLCLPASPLFCNTLFHKGVQAIYKNTKKREFLGSPVVKTQHFHCHKPESSPSLENKDPRSHSAWPPKIRNIIKAIYRILIFCSCIRKSKMRQMTLILALYLLKPNMPNCYHFNMWH